jgi:predicted DNA-binding transcriptional regulator YafY
MVCAAGIQNELANAVAASMSQTERILKIQQMLHDRGVVSQATFRSEFQVSNAQFKRDLAFLRDRFQVPIEYDAKKRGYLIPPSEDGLTVELPGPMYTAKEIHGLLIMEDLVKQLQPGLLDEHLKPLRERLKLLLGREDLPSDEIRKRIRILHMASRQSEPRHFRQVSQATLTRKRLKLRYYNRTRDDSTDREVSPQRLVYYRGNWYLDAWCHLRNDLRSFAVDAMKKVSLTDIAAQEIETASLDANLGAGYGIFSGVADKSAILRFEPTAARWVAAERWHAKQIHAVEPTGHLVLTVPYSNEPELVMDILRYGADVEVLAPDALRATVTQRLKDTLGKYIK